MQQIIAARDNAPMADVPVRRIGVADLRAALSAGIADFQAIPTHLLFLGIIYPVFGLVAARAVVGNDLVPLLFPLVAGISLLGPVLAVGVYELSRRREAGLPLSWLNAFDVLRSPAIGSIATLGVVLLAIFTAWIGVAKLIFDRTMVSAPTAPDDFIAAVFQTPLGWQLTLVGNLVGLLFAVLVLMLTIVSVPMMLDRNVGIAVAVRTSVRAVLANPAVLALWGVIVAVALLLGCIPFFFGLAVVMPVLGHATWHLYRRLIG